MARKKPQKHSKTPPRPAEAVQPSSAPPPAPSEAAASPLNPNYFLFLLLLAVFIGCYHIIKPYLHTVILALLFAIIAKPIHVRFTRWFGGRENLAAFFSCILVTLLVILPLLFMSLALIQQGIQSFNAIYRWIEAGKYAAIIEHAYVQWLLIQIESLLPDVQKLFPDINLKTIEFDKIALTASATMGKALLNQGGHIAGNLTALAGQFLLFLFTFFFLLRDEEKVFAYILHLLPLSASQEEKIVAKIKAVAKSAILGTLVTAAAQGAAGGAAFAVVGLPGFFWGIVMAFASLIPLVGTALIWIPATIYLVFFGSWIMGLGLALWCIVVVGSIDNFVRPMFMQGSADMSTLLIFFALLGGVNYFGLIGLLYGPLIFGLAMVLLYIYSVEFEDFLNRQDRR